MSQKIANCLKIVVKTSSVISLEKKVIFFKIYYSLESQKSHIFWEKTLQNAGWTLLGSFLPTILSNLLQKEISVPKFKKMGKKLLQLERVYVKNLHVKWKTLKTYSGD